MKQQRGLNVLLIACERLHETSVELILRNIDKSSREILLSVTPVGAWWLRG